MWVQSFSALLIVIATIALLRLVLRFFGVASTSAGRRSMQVVESCPLGTKQRLVIVQVDGERLLLGSSEGSLQMLRRLPPVATAAGEEAEIGASGESGHGTPEGCRSDTPGGWRQIPWSGWRHAARNALRSAGLASVLVGCLLAAEPAFAQTLAADTGDQGASLTLSLDGATNPDRIASTLQILLLMTVMSVAPSLLLVATSFTRIVIVLSLLRQAIGIHQLPPSQIIVGLALFVTFYVMTPVGTQIKEQALDPYMAREIGEQEAMENAMGPVRQFMMTHTRQSDLDLFNTLSGKEPPENLEDIAFSSLLPSFMISEIRTAFEIGFMIYLPFLIVDIVIASMLISMGMIVLPPIIISLPFKLMLFVLLDGWNLVITALVSGLL